MLWKMERDTGTKSKLDYSKNSQSQKKPKPDRNESGRLFLTTC